MKTRAPHVSMVQKRLVVRRRREGGDDDDDDEEEEEERKVSYGGGEELQWTAWTLPFFIPFFHPLSPPPWPHIYSLTTVHPHLPPTVIFSLTG